MNKQELALTLLNEIIRSWWTDWSTAVKRVKDPGVSVELRLTDTGFEVEWSVYKVSLYETSYGVLEVKACQPKRGEYTSLFYDCVKGRKIYNEVIDHLLGE